VNQALALPPVAAASQPARHREAATDAPRQADLKWDPLMLCIAGYVLVAVGRVHQLFPVLGLFRPAIVMGLFAVLLLVRDGSRVRRVRWVLVPTTRCIIAFLVWIALSTPIALVRGTSFDLLFGNFIKTFLMYLVIAAGVRGIRDVERIALAYLASAAIYAAVILSRFNLGSGDSWRLGDLYYYDANDFATFVVTALPIALYMIHRARVSYQRVLGIVVLTVLTVAFVHSGSRGGFLALIAVAAFFIVGYRAIALRWRVTATVLVSVVLLGTASDRYWAQMGTITSDSDYNRFDETGRIKIWERGIGYMLQYPMFGVGAGNFNAAEGRLSEYAQNRHRGVRWNAAHNSYIQVGAELGIPGLLMFVGMIATAFVALRRSSRRLGKLRGHAAARELTQAIAAALIGFAVGAIFLSLAYSEILFTLLALAVGLAKVTR
jgi:probable O-glycosylation ligase (exosortase A-associated)